MEKTTRCVKACDACRKRKERCTGGIPCTLCARRNNALGCRYTDHTGGPAPKRRRTNPSLPPMKAGIHVPRISQRLRVSDDDSATVVVGDSSTLGLLCFVRKLASLTNESPVAVLENDAMLEVSHTQSQHYPSIPLASIPAEVVETCMQSYLNFVHGIFDVFPEIELRKDVSAWSSTHLHDGEKVSSSALSFVLAIGAEQNGRADLGRSLFDRGYEVLSTVLLLTPDLALLQSLLMLVLYLLLTCRRNAAFVHLGSAIQTAYAIGLHETSSCPGGEAERRAWKCLRILDISTCASLGRPIGTSRCPHIEVTTDETDNTVDLASLKLCLIAENILTTVYSERKLSAQFALNVSQDLKDWANNIPGVLVSGSKELDNGVADIPVRQRLCGNHMTAAYYWTIILLTRPFLMDDVLSRAESKLIGGAATQHATLIDACIDSAFRCLDATVVLVRYPDLPTKLFLVVNTTLVSALILILAFFGDYDKTFPLDEGLDMADQFLQHLSAHDPQAAQCLDYIRSLRDTAREYCKKRAVAELERRGAQVSAIFGAVRPIGRPSDTRSVGEQKANDECMAQQSTPEIWNHNEETCSEEGWDGDFVDLLDGCSGAPAFTDFEAPLNVSTSITT